MVISTMGKNKAGQVARRVGSSYFMWCGQERPRISDDS